MSSISDYIELQRRFTELKSDSNPETIAEDSYMSNVFGLKIGSSWDEILDKRIAVILGEPGSGKTYELHNKSRELAKTQYSFYIPLDRLVHRDLNDSLLSGDVRQFKRWMATSKDHAYFFLDAVDEAKLRRPQDFALAMEQVAKGVNHKRHRNISVVLSSRISDWDVHSDLTSVLEILDSSPLIKQKKPLKGNDFWTINESTNLNSKEELSGYRIVQLLPLDREQIELIAQHHISDDSTAFMNELEEKDYWDFARRPSDVIDLLNHWSEKGKLGSLTKTIESSLLKKLAETPDRTRKDVLSREESRIGAESLGAATVFCKTSSLKYPSLNSTDTGNKGIDVTECLPADWTQDKYAALLDRALFDSSSFGHTRFHHRRFGDFLCASWLYKRMENGCPYPELESLFFKTVGSKFILRPSMKPILAWLAPGDKNWQDRLRGSILNCSPELFLSYGDASELTPEYRLQIILQLLTRYEGRERTYTDYDRQALSRLAESGFAVELSKIISDSSNSSGVKILVLEIIRYARIVQSTDEVLNIITNSSLDSQLSHYALITIRDIGNKKDLASLQSMIPTSGTLQSETLVLFFEALYPKVMDEKGIYNLLQMSEEITEFSSGLPDQLRWHIKHNLSHINIEQLLYYLVKLITQKPHHKSPKDNDPISRKYFWLQRVIPPLISHLLIKTELASKDLNTATEALWLMEHFDHKYSIPEKDLKSIAEGLKNNQELRKAYFNKKIDKLTTSEMNESMVIYRFFRWESPISPEIDDVTIFTEDLSDCNSELAAFKTNLAIHVWIKLGRKWSVKRILKKALAHDEALTDMLSQESKVSLAVRKQRLIQTIGIPKLEFRTRQLKNSLKSMNKDYMDRIHVGRNRDELEKGDHRELLIDLAHEFREGSNHWGDVKYESLRKKYGSKSAKAVLAGWNSIEKEWVPQLPHEKENPNQVPWNTTLGLCGITTSLSVGLYKTSSMKTNDVMRATRYAINELNGFSPWLSALCEDHPNVVREVLTLCVKGEWEIDPSRENVDLVLSRLIWKESTIQDIIVPPILTALEEKDPIHPQVLENAISILLQSNKCDFSTLSELAENRILDYDPADREFLVWMITLLQINSKPGIALLSETLDETPKPSELMIRICGRLGNSDSRNYLEVTAPDYINVEFLTRFIPLVHIHVAKADDIDRTKQGTYSPGSRDYAQSFRAGILDRLSQIPGNDTVLALKSLIIVPVLVEYSDYILHLIERREELDSDIAPWDPSDIPLFMEEYEVKPKSNYALFKIGVRRLDLLKDMVERGDASKRKQVAKDADESVLRTWLITNLRDVANSRYTAEQESEVDLEQRPDIRISAPGIGYVSIEVKWAHKQSFSDLEKGLRDQLVGQYLRAHDSKCGIYIIGYVGQQEEWVNSSNGDRYSFDQLVSYLNLKCNEILENNPEIDALKLVTIDFTRPSS